MTQTLPSNPLSPPSSISPPSASSLSPDNDTTLRQRKIPSSADPTRATKDSPAAAALKKSDNPPFNVLEILRALAGLLLAGSLAGYLVTGSFTWHLQERRPWWLQKAGLSSVVNAPLALTLPQLSHYNGATPGTPIYLALNRTIYDVSASPHVYGPGGMYSSLSAKDASKAYITTCFDPVDDLVPYLSGLEELYVPLWLSRNPGKEELDALVSAEGAGADVAGGKTGKQLLDDVRSRVGAVRVKRMQKEAYAAGFEKVAQQIKTWEGMFERKGYPVVGKVVGVDEKDASKWKGLGICEAARKLRPGMAESLGGVMQELAAEMGREKGDVGMGKGGKGKEGAKGKEGGKEGKGKGGAKESADKSKPKPQTKEKKEKKEDKKAKKPAAHDHAHDHPNPHAHGPDHAHGHDHAHGAHAHAHAHGHAHP